LNTIIPIHLVIEDDLSEAVLRRVLRERTGAVRYECRTPFQNSGFGQLRRNVRAFNEMARVCPVLMLTDLDRYPCATALIDEWLPTTRHPEFLFRVAVREVEAWLLGSHEEIIRFLRLRRRVPVPHPEALDDPKDALLQMAQDSPSRELRNALVQADRYGRRRQGPAYNLTLNGFVCDFWNIEAASGSCPSLKRLMNRLASFEGRFG
jgi:hypothetical protein